MLRDGLRAEIPAVFDLAARARRPSVPRMSPALAALGALGAQSLTTALIHTAQGAYVFGIILFRGPEPWLPQLRTFSDAPRPFDVAIDWMLVTPLLYVAVALLTLVVGSVVACYLATSTPTIP